MGCGLEVTIPKDYETHFTLMTHLHDWSTKNPFLFNQGLLNLTLHAPPSGCDPFDQKKVGYVALSSGTGSDWMSTNPTSSILSARVPPCLLSLTWHSL